MGYQLTFIRGLSWSSGLKIASKLLTAGKIAILARLLSPTDFGLFSLVLVALSVVEVFMETGINTIIVQSKKEISYYLNTAWVVSIVRGFGIAVLMVILSYPLRYFYQESTLTALIFIAASVPIIRGFINPAIVTFHKHLNFKTDTVYRFSLALADVVFAVLFAFIWPNIYALIFSVIMNAVIDVVLSYSMVRQWPKFQFSRNVFAEILDNTKWLNGFSILDYLNKNVDDLIIGRTLGIQSLGFYRNGYALTQSGTAEFGLSVIHAAFPVLTKIEDPKRFRKAVLKVLGSFSLVLLIPTIIFCTFPEFIVKVLLGDEWLAVIPLVPLLAIAGYLQGIENIISTIFIAKKSYKFLLLTLLLTLGVMVITLAPLSLQYGLWGAGLSILLSRVISLPLYFFGTWRSVSKN